MNKPQSFIDQDRAATLLEKWAPVLDYTSDSVKAIEDDHTRLNTAVLLENQEKWCIEEDNSTGGGALGGSAQGGVQFNPNVAGGSSSADTYAPNDARLPKVLIPMIRRTFPELITNEIVGVQPMSGPVGLAFALRYAYQNEYLGTGIDGKTQAAAGGQAAKTPGLSGSAGLPQTELGYQLLDTRFTGASSADLAGDAGYWAFADQDKGVAQILSAFEITGNIPQVEVKFEKTAVAYDPVRTWCRIWTWFLSMEPCFC
jgi:hypothetical protein